MSKYRLICDSCLKSCETVRLTKQGALCSLCIGSNAYAHNAKQAKVSVRGKEKKKVDLDVTFEEYLTLGGNEKWYSCRCITDVAVLRKIIKYELTKGKTRYNTAVKRLKKLTR
jgi:hypothetical protein